MPDEIQGSDALLNAVRNRYAFEGRGTVEIQGKGAMETYFLR